MADRQLPTVPSAAGSDAHTPGNALAPPGADAPGRGPGPPPDGSRPAAPRWWRRGDVLAALGWVALLAGGLLLSLGTASLVGDRVREAVLVEVDRSPVGSEPSYSDAPQAAAAFFARRDTVTVRVARDMTVADFLGLYHLETNAAARAALRDQLGAVSDEDVLREGDRVTLTVTVGREAP